MARKHSTPDVTPSETPADVISNMMGVTDAAPNINDDGAVTDIANTKIDHGKLPPLAKFHKFKRG